MEKSWFQRLDEDWFHRINGMPEGWEPVFKYFSAGAKDMTVLIVLVAAAIGLLWWNRTRTATILALIAWPGANGLTDLLKNLIPTLRPNVDPVDAILRVGYIDSPGTASAHAANMAAVAFAFCWAIRPWKDQPWSVRLIGIGWIVVAILTGISRIYVGVHYPSQVLLGWAVGCLVAYVIATFGLAIVKRKKPAPGEPAA